MEDSEEEKLWQLYVARSGSLSPFDGSFNDFKESVIPTVKIVERKSLVQVTTEAEDILKRCNPKKGADN